MTDNARREQARLEESAGTSKTATGRTRVLVALNLLFLIWILVVIRSCASTPEVLTRNTDLVRCACYPDIATSGAGIGSQGLSVREFLFRGQQLRVRQNGTIEKVELYIADLTDTDGLYITIWRKRGRTYDRVGESENMVASLIAGRVNELLLSDPVTDVEEGDYYGVRIAQNGPNPTEQLVARDDVENAVAFWMDSNPGDMDVDWDGLADGATLPGTAVPIRLYMQAPMMVAIGDSIVAGHPGNYSFIEEIPVSDPAASFPHHVAKSLDVTMQNMGAGNESVAEIERRFRDDCVSLKPRIAIIETGFRDLMIGTSEFDFRWAWNEMLKDCRENGIVAVVLGIPPFTMGTSEQVSTRDEWNEALRSLAGEFRGFIYVDYDDYVGQFREDGPPGNMWDIRDEYDADGVHFTPPGYEKIGGAVVDSMRHLVHGGD